MATVNGKIVGQYMDSSGSNWTEFLGYVDSDVNTADTTVATAIDNYSRAVKSLTTGTYVDTTVTYEYSLTEILSD